MDAGVGIELFYVDWTPIEGTHVYVGGTLFINKINPFSLPEEDYERLQLDVVYKFN